MRKYKIEFKYRNTSNKYVQTFRNMEANSPEEAVELFQKQHRADHTIVSVWEEVLTTRRVTTTELRRPDNG